MKISNVRHSAPRLKGEALRASEASSTAGQDFWDLKLYVAGLNPGADLAVSNLKRICEQYMAGHYRIKVIDLLRHPRLARGEQILAVPTLVRQLPSPMRKLIGDLSDTHGVLVGLDLVQGPSGN